MRIECRRSRASSESPIAAAAPRIAFVQELLAVDHRMLVEPGIEGTVAAVVVVVHIQLLIEVVVVEIEDIPHHLAVDRILLQVVVDRADCIDLVGYIDLVVDCIAPAVAGHIALAVVRIVLVASTAREK